MRGLLVALALLVAFGLGIALDWEHLGVSVPTFDRHECSEEMEEVRSRWLYQAPDAVYDYRHEVSDGVEFMRDWEFLTEREDGQLEGVGFAFLWGPSTVGCQVRSYRIEPYFGGEQ